MLEVSYETEKIKDDSEIFGLSNRKDGVAVVDTGEAGRGGELFWSCLLVVLKLRCLRAMEGRCEVGSWICGIQGRHRG